MDVPIPYDQKGAVLVYSPTKLGDFLWANVGIHIPAQWGISAMALPFNSRIYYGVSTVPSIFWVIVQGGIQGGVVSPFDG